MPASPPTPTRKDWLWLAPLGLLVAWLWSLPATAPGYMDIAYYTTNGARLAAGHGFTEEIIWQYLDDPAGLPTPSHTYWMPLPSLLAAGGYLLGDSYQMAQLPFVILVGLLPLLAYQIAGLLRGARWQAITAALLTMSGGYFAAYWTQPETFAPFAWAGGLALYWLAADEPGWRWLGVGLLAGLAHLTRADGLLLLVVALLVVWWPWRKRPFARLAPSAQIMLGYGLAMAAWFWRNWQALGRPLPTTGTQTIFLTTYDDLFAYDRSFSLANWQAWGWDNVLLSRLEGLWLGAQSLLAVGWLVFLAPFIIWAWLRLWRSGHGRSLLPLTLYLPLLYLAMSLIFTLPGVRGGFYHSLAAVWPWQMALAPFGITFAVEWAAQRLPHWQPARAARIFSALFVAVAWVIGLALGLPRLLPDETEIAAYTAAAALVPETAVVIVGDAPSFHYHTGLRAINVPNEPLPTLLTVAARYEAAYLLLDPNRPRPLDALYAAEETHPAVTALATWDGYQLYAITQEQP